MNHSLEQDIKASDWMVAKIKNSKVYAQNLYAAMCNNEFIHYDVLSILKEDTWRCSWRYAGGIMADIRGGDEDYMDYYCSGIRNEVQEITNDPDEEDAKNYVSESYVTAQIKSDLFVLGWFVKDIKDTEY
jgi:hypothetical protein